MIEYFYSSLESMHFWEIKDLDGETMAEIFVYCDEQLTCDHKRSISRIAQHMQVDLGAAPPLINK